ncbi:hypothetical protein NIES2109_23810 [Nostoc sp. HK-01]|nr:hypothetical protein NIES2109_23810 [Nostoc sp. HK-01]
MQTTANPEDLIVVEDRHCQQNSQLTCSRRI